jgi:hypothetical protein
MKKILIFCFLLLGTLAYGQLDTINIGTAPNNGTGESLRSGMIKVNIAIRQINTLTTSSTNWNTAYTDRLKWDGGSTGLVAATGRTSLGATTVGAAFFMLTNPSVVTFPRINADNSISALSAANFKTALSLSATDVGLGNVTNESKATMFTNPTFTGHPTIEGVTMTGATGTGNLVFSASPTITGTPSIAGYVPTSTTVNGHALSGNISVTATDVSLGNLTNKLQVEVEDSNKHTAGNYLTWKYLIDTLAAVYAEFHDTVLLETIVQLNSDSAIYIPFVIGGGHLGDTALFVDSVICGSFYNYKDTLVAVYLNGVMIAGTGMETLDFNVKWHSTFQSASATKLNTAALTITSLTTGTTDASFNNSIIPPGVRVWGVANGFSPGNRPSYFEGTLVCYKLNRSY